MSDDRPTASTFLLSELRRARSAAGLTQEDLGKAIKYSGSLVSAVENGQRPPTREFLLSVDTALHTGGLFERLLIAFEQVPVWFRDWLIIEREATLIRWFEPVIVPGLLQTEPYARAIMAGAGLVGRAKIEQRVAARMERQRILTNPRPPVLIVLIDEGVLRRSVGDAAIMAAQCEHLLERMADRNVQVHVLPASAGPHAGLAGPFILAKGCDYEAAHVDTPWQAQILHRRDAIDALSERWEAIRGEALPRRQSLDLIKEVAQFWQE